MYLFFIFYIIYIRIKIYNLANSTYVNYITKSMSIYKSDYTNIIFLQQLKKLIIIIFDDTNK